MPSLYDETVTDLGEALMSENERLEQELEAAREVSVVIAYFPL